ncbi:hypothetical protein [Picrophilus oshimae]|uniref:Uncharacterized protein n=1 Tax=Picrophilus torridus (strain ATCC 700027 / DSM 9790 / JCM 10055 / NBRC 100828 / KAW 2/3) TaxID=1122961 RepID=A0A8G2FY64_PICTO|nr:hypothetical protein [Picrophilus oshimae]SMD31703.1 hypothetical protein SAMN02745355_1621 [Picrophilus oshimae DSM 9789]
MKKLFVLLVLALFAFATMSVSSASPALPAPPSTLPTVTYYYHNTSYNITNSIWDKFFKDVIDNKTYVKYSWSNVSTQYLIVFDLSYTGLNHFGLELISALSGIGSPTIANMTKAFISIENQPSLVHGYTNIGALNAGAYPGLSFSKPAVQSKVKEYEEITAIVAIIAVMFVLYFYFNRNGK